MWLRLLFKVFFARKNIKIMFFFVFLNLFLTSKRSKNTIKQIIWSKKKNHILMKSRLKLTSKHPLRGLLPALFKHPLAGMLSLVLHQFGKLLYSPWFSFYRTNGQLIVSKSGMFSVHFFAVLTLRRKINLISFTSCHVSWFLTYLFDVFKKKKKIALLLFLPKVNSL